MVDLLCPAKWSAKRRLNYPSVSSLRTATV
jgi:hypothetical protein